MRVEVEITNNEDPSVFRFALNLTNFSGQRLGQVQPFGSLGVETARQVQRSQEDLIGARELDFSETETIFVVFPIQKKVGCIPRENLDPLMGDR